ncbi:MAG TPA: ATP-binding protein [Planctomycetota bacterium]|jgi:two-component system sensor histidine kinase QseC|nr:ATP-binding protein [Planctomycetota bacterium]
MRSIRRRLTLGLLATLLPLLATGGAGLYLYVRRALLQQLDSTLADKARVLASLVVRSEGRVELDVDGEDLPEFGRDGDPEFFQISLQDGSTIARSRSLEGGALPLRAGSLAAPDFWDLSLPEGRAGRGVGVRFVPKTEEEDGSNPQAPAPRAASLADSVLLVLAQDRSSVDHPLSILLTALLVVGALALGAASLAVTRIVGRGLSPLAQVANLAAGIDASSLGRRFPEADVPAELAPICARLNELLTRLEHAFERERRFTADAAHELRTPIAELRALAEVALRFPGDGEATARSLRDALDIARQMERLVAALLGLARCDAGRQLAVLETVDLGGLVREAWRDLDGTARARDLSVVLDVEGAGKVETDRALAGAILSNLLSNAVEHAPPGGRVECRANDENGTVVLSLGNTHDSLRPSDLPHLFEPFWRKDPARGRSSHAGLGLAVVAAFSRVLGIRVSPELPEPNWFRVRIPFPRSARGAAKG